MGYEYNTRNERMSGILLRRVNKFIIEKDKDLDDLFKRNLTATLKYDYFISNLKYNIEIKSCNLLSCTINVDDVQFEFENGKLVSTETIDNKEFMKKLEEIVEEETEKILKKLALPLTLNENINNLGYCFGPEFLKILSFLTENEIDKLSDDLIPRIKSIIGTEVEYKPPFLKFPREHLESKMIYPSYCRWLNSLEHSIIDNETVIPSTYKINYEKMDKDTNEENKSYKVITPGSEEEFCQLMINLLNSTETYNEKDVDDLSRFIDIFGDHLSYIPQIVPNKENLSHIVKMILRFHHEKSPLEALISKYQDVCVDDVLGAALVFSGHSISDLGKYKPFQNFMLEETELLIKLLEKCSNRLEEMMKYKNAWARCYEKMYLNNFREKYPEIMHDLYKVSKQRIFNTIFLKKRLKVMIDKKSDLNDYFKNNLEGILQQNEFSGQKIKVKSCNLLNCILTVDDTDIEFENGKLIRSNSVTDDEIVEKVKNIVKDETQKISDKLNIVLTLQDDLYKLGFCMDAELVRNVALFNEIEIEEFGQLLVDVFKQILGSKVKYEPTYKEFPREHLAPSLTYFTYCKRLLTLETFKYDQRKIPTSYKLEFEESPNFERIKSGLNGLKLKIVSMGEKTEFFDMIVNMMDSSESLSVSDINDLNLFVRHEENHLEYIPKTIINKENLANVANMILKYYGDKPPMDVLLPMFNNANDVLRLALVMSNQSASDLGKRCRFKSFKNLERRMLMELLNHCKNRYEDIMKYKNMWERFCEKVHPAKFRKIYPDVINDIQGSYSILGKPENKDIRMEYRLYQTLFELDEKFNEYKKEIIEYCSYPNIIFGELNDNNDNKNDENDNEEFDRIKESLENMGKKWKWIKINSAYLRSRNRLGTNYNSCFTFTKPISNTEHHNLLKKLKKVKTMPEDIKKYVTEYILNLSQAIYSNIIEYSNRSYVNCPQFKIWDSEKRKTVIKEDFKDIFYYLPTLLPRLNDYLFPSIDKELINKRIQVIQPAIIQLRNENRQYKHDRQSFDSKYVEFIKNNQIDEAAKLLSQRPGVFLRHLDELITKSKEQKEILTFMERVAQKSSVKVLLSVKGYFQKRGEKIKGRAFLIKGATKRNLRKVSSKTTNAIYYTDKSKEPLTGKLCEEIIHLCDQALISHFKLKPELHGVYISPELQKLLIPFDLRQSSKSLENFSKGSRLDLSFKNITKEEKERMIKEAEINLENKKILEDKIFTEKKDLEIKLLNLERKVEEDQKRKEEYEKIHGKNLMLLEKSEEDKKAEEREELLKAYRKEFTTVEGDLNAIQKKLEQLKKELHEKKNCPIGTTYQKIRLFTMGYTNLFVEVYDENFKLDTIIGMGPKRKVFNSDNSYQIYYGENEDGYRFVDVDIDLVLSHNGRYILVNIGNGNGHDGKFGWMERNFLNSDENFEPATVRQNISLNYSGDACPVILDCKTREFIWTDYAIPTKYFNNLTSFIGKYHSSKTIIDAIIERDSNKNNNNNNRNTTTTTNNNNNVNLNTIDAEEISRYRDIYKSYNKYLEINKKYKYGIFYYYVDPLRLSMSDLIHLHIQARNGKLLEKEEELSAGDTAFTSLMPLTKKDKVNYIACSNLEIILSEYMK